MMSNNSIIIIAAKKNTPNGQKGTGEFNDRSTKDNTDLLIIMPSTNLLALSLIKHKIGISISANQHAFTFDSVFKNSSSKILK